MKAAICHSSIHLNEPDVVDCRDRCPVCHSSEPRQIVLHLQALPDVYLLRCARCSVCSASHMPTEQCLERYYSTYYGESDQKITFTDPARFARHILRSMRVGASTRSLRVLDFGGGDGGLALAIARRLTSRNPNIKVEIKVVDVQEAQPSTEDGISVSYVRSVEQAAGQYDIVLASAILEHIPQVHDVIQQLFARVNPGGYFYARTPFVVPFTTIVGRLDFTYPAHVHDMGSGFWNRVREIFKFDAVQIASRPSIVETGLKSHPARTVAAYVLKFPARVEGVLSPASRKDRWWNFVGGWEVVLQRNGNR